MNFRRMAILVGALTVWGVSRSEILPARGSADGRVRAARYDDSEVYRLHGLVGYEIDLQFEPGEVFVGLGAGDIEGLSFVAQDNHLFLKPRAAKVETNLTVLTNRRHYQIDYTAASRRAVVDPQDLIYSLRFIYPPIPKPDETADRISSALGNASASRAINFDYWYCGDRGLKPVAASDDGVHTRLRFGTRVELPGIFVKADDGAESLLNFSLDGGDVIIHRVAPRFVLRRGSLSGCIVNKGFAGSGERLDSGTVTPEVRRAVKETLP